MKSFGQKNIYKVIYFSSVGTSSFTALAAAFLCQKYIVKQNLIETFIPIVYLPGVFFFVMFLVFYHGIKALLCWHTVVTQKKLGLPVSFSELWHCNSIHRER